MTDARERIEAALSRENLTAGEWRQSELDGLEAVVEGEWGVIDDDEDRGLFAGDRGQLTACVVGAPEHGNERVAFYFIPAGCDSGDEVRPGEDVEQL
jgi:hypothetical protein